MIKFKLYMNMSDNVCFNLWIKIFDCLVASQLDVLKIEIVSMCEILCNELRIDNVKYKVGSGLITIVQH